MAADTSLARNLVTLLTAEQPFSKSATVIYSHDDVLLPDGSTVVRVGIGGPSPRTRQTRNDWTVDGTIRVTISGRQQMNTTTEAATAQTDIDDWLDFVDEIADHVQDMQPSSKKASFIEFEERYDDDMLRNENLFLSSFLVTYRLL